MPKLVFPTFCQNLKCMILHRQSGIILMFYVNYDCICVGMNVNAFTNQPDRLQPDRPRVR